MTHFFLFLTLMICQFASAAKYPTVDSQLSARQRIRALHARELLGKKMLKQMAASFDKGDEFDKTIHKLVKKKLPKAYRNQSWIIAETIIHEAHKHKLDPFLLMALIEGESSFNPKALGPVGELGLMQLRSSTAKWIAERMNIKWRGKDSLKNPVTNIRIGTAYVAWLRKEFKNHGQLYLAAYNMGPGSVRKNVKKKVMPKIYPHKVMKKYLAYYK